MKKLLVVFLVFVTGCVSGGTYITFDKCEFYKIGSEEEGDVYYFSYPQGGEVKEIDGMQIMNFSSCSVEFGDWLYYDVGDDLDVEIKKNSRGNVNYEAWYMGDKVVRYGGILSNYDYNFWLTDYENGVSNCILVLEKMAESFTDKPFYYNNKYGFKIDLLPDYKVEDLPSGEGVQLKKWMGDNVCTDDWGEEYECGYKVEILVSATDNVMGYQSLAEFLALKYSGYSVEHVNYGKNPGVFVDEGAGEDAVRHYFMMDDGAKYIYEAYLKTPSIYYSQNKEEFDGIMNTFELL